MNKFIIIFLLLCAFSVSLFGNQVEYWHLKPFTNEEINEEKFYTYKALHLCSESFRMQLRIKSADEKNLTTWAKLETPTEALNFSFGQSFIIYINKLSPQDGYIEFNDTKISCKMEWDAPKAESFDISEIGLIASEEPFLISGQIFRAYSGHILRNEYSYGTPDCFDLGARFERVCMQNQSVQLEIQLNSHTSIQPLYYHWTDNVVISSERQFDKDRINVVNNSFMNMCKRWTKTDIIIILIHENFPAYRWIVNVTRKGESFFCKGSQPLYTVTNVWEKITQ